MDPIQQAPTLRRALSFGDLLIYGIIFMSPIAPFSIYGYVSEASSGMVALAYLVGMLAMYFTAASYKALSEDFAVGGSAYAYARLGIGEWAGFVAGWMMILDYLLVPALTYVVTATAVQQLIPSIPRWSWILIFLAAGTIVNYVGVTVAAAVNKVLLALQLLTVIAFIAVGLHALFHGAGAPGLTLQPLFRPAAFHPGAILSAVAICALSFLGFDAISTLSEEVRGDSRKLVGRATVVCLLLTGSLFVMQTWVAADLANGMKFSSADTAFYEIAERAGGKPLALMCTWTAALVFGIASSTVGLPAIARLVFTMARDRKMPASLAAVHPRFKTPYRSLLVVALISLVIAFAFADHLDAGLGFINFGALTGFLILHAAVMVHFVWRKRSRAIFRHIVSPLIGFGLIASVMAGMSGLTWGVGLAWMFAGAAGMAVVSRKRSMRSVLN